MVTPGSSRATTPKMTPTTPLMAIAHQTWDSIVSSGVDPPGSAWPNRLRIRNVVIAISSSQPRQRDRQIRSASLIDLNTGGRWAAAPFSVITAPLSAYWLSDTEAGEFGVRPAFSSARAPSRMPTRP